MADRAEAVLRDRAMLDVAEGVLAGRIAVPPVWRVRSAAVIGRSALEQAIRRRLRELAGMPIGTNRTRHQLICLRELSGGARWAKEAAWAYSALSRACHEHAYELEPTHNEVAHLIDLVRRVVEEQ